MLNIKLLYSYVNNEERDAFKVASSDSSFVSASLERKALDKEMEVLLAKYRLFNKFLN